MKLASTSSSDLVRSYLREIGRIPLLTHEEEIVLGKQVQASRKLLALKAEIEEESEHQASLEMWAARANLSIAEVQKVIADGETAKRKMV
ncbi:MAG: RNA polymerase sigma factor, RpoD/SigA family, partial [Symploca sp. SIO2B6]|nr:RNA polymerase sigma factor, RpoD/SigA family [Symploca sp. SIO2B6]